MSRNRIIYPQEALFVSPSPSTGTQSGILQIHRVQSANYSWNVNRTDVLQYGQQGRIDSVIIEPPTVSLNFSYLLTNMNNEQNLGFTVNQNVSCISGLSANDDRNYYMTLAPQGQDNIGLTESAANPKGVYAFGNGFISSYTTEAAIGSFPTVNVAVESLNFRAYASGLNQPTPAINPKNGADIIGPTFTIPATVSGKAGQATALRPGDIVMDLNAVDIIGALASDIKIQSYSLSLEFNRENLQKLGSDFAYSKEIQYPINASLTVEALAGDITTGSLNRVLCNDKDYNLAINLYNPACPPATGVLAANFQLRGAKLDSSDWSSSIGPSKSVSLRFSSPLSGPQDILRGVFMSGTIN